MTFPLLSRPTLLALACSASWLSLIAPAHAQQAPRTDPAAPVQSSEPATADEAEAEDVMAAIRGASGEVATLLVVGHNPGLGDLAVLLTGSGPRGLRALLASEFPTAAFAVIAFDGAVAPGQGRLEHFVRPRDIDPALAG